MSDDTKDDKTNVLRKSRADVGDVDLRKLNEATAVDSDGQTLPAPIPVPSSSQPSLSGARALTGLTRPTIRRRFGRYELLLELAAGGMATLYLARLRGPSGFEKLVALKIIHPHLTREQSFVKMFFDEARISAMVHHPNVVQVLDLGQIDDIHYIAMEYVHGKDYRAVLRGAYHRSKQGLTLSQVPDWLIAARVAADAAAGLHAAHELVDSKGDPLGLVHRDVSPHNILLSYDGHVKLTDFGIAYAKHRMTQTDSGVLKGKLAYMSPEQAEGTNIDRRADIFTLGIVLWEAVCQKRLFRRESDTATLYALTHTEIPRPRDVREDLPAELEQIILRTLAKRPGVRYQTSQELARALEQLIARHDDVIGASELSTVMSTLFTEQRAKLDQEISDAMDQADAQAEADVPQEAVPQHERTGTNLAELPRASKDPDEEVGVSETRLSAQALRTIPSPARRSSQLTVSLIAVAALVIAGVAGYLLWRRPPAQQRSGVGVTTAPMPQQPPREAPRPMQTPPPMERARPVIAPPPVRPANRKLVLSFVIKPARARATIRFRGKRYRQNRVDLLVTAGETTERVRVEAPGYYPLERFVTVRPQAALKHELTLKPRRRRPGSRPVTPRAPMDMTPRPVDIGFD